MPLKTFVKVGRISNLSDARYCAGMGVDMLGFRVMEDQEGYISPKLYQEIRGWVSVPFIVAEVDGLKSERLSSILSEYAPQYLECGLDTFRALIDKTDLPFIVSLRSAEIARTGEDPRVSYWLVNDQDVVPENDLVHLTPVLAKVSSKESADRMLRVGGVRGLALDGSREERPGFKDYEAIADILENLDE